MSSHGRSPVPRSEAASPRPAFDSDALKAYIKKLLSSTLQGHSYPPPHETARVKAWCKEIGDRVKERMLEIDPRTLQVLCLDVIHLIEPASSKYIVLTRIDENLGQGGHANLVCHWEDSDAVAQEVYSNDSLICVCVAFATRTL